MGCVKDPYLQATDFIKVNVTPTHTLAKRRLSLRDKFSKYFRTHARRRERGDYTARISIHEIPAGCSKSQIDPPPLEFRPIYIHTHTPRINLNPISVLLINFPSARAANSIIICNFGSPPPRESFYGGIKTRCCCCCCLECTMAVAKLRCHARQWGAFVIDNELQGGVSITKRRLLAR